MTNTNPTMDQMAAARTANSAVSGLPSQPVVKASSPTASSERLSHPLDGS
jgi:hypothetical protein